MTLVKICGVTTAEDASMVATSGATHLGLNLWPSSPRALTVDAAAALARAARAANPAVNIVGVFVAAGATALADAHQAVRFDAVQLHGDEPPALAAAVKAKLGVAVWKAIAVRDRASLDQLESWRQVDLVLLDAASPARGGSGTRFDWELAAVAVGRWPDLAIGLAGGLSADNVAEAIRQVAPRLVDVASGVERSPGIKDAARVAAFVRAAGEEKP